MSPAPAPSLPEGLPPAPDLPRSRLTARWLARPVELMRSLQREHGDPFAMHLLHEPPWVLTADPELVKQIFTAPADVLHAGSQKRILEPILGPGSVLLADGREHMRKRRLLLPHFHATAVAAQERRMREVATAEIERWPTGAAAPAAPRLSAIALEVIVRALFEASGEKRVAVLREAIESLVEYIAEPRRAMVALGAAGSRVGQRRFAELRDLIAGADRVVIAEIARRRKLGGASGGDLLDMLLAARDENGTPLSDSELRDELMTLLIAGHETTATSLAWALERLVRLPAVLARVSAEAQEGGGTHTEAAIRETLRLRSPFMVVPRLAVQTFRLGELEIPPGVAVTPAIPLVHRNPALYRAPDEFRPERFLDRAPETYAWIPFGGGVRRCLGAGFALLQMRVVLSTLLSHATIRVADPAPEPALRRLLVMAPKYGPALVLQRD